MKRLSMFHGTAPSHAPRQIAANSRQRLEGRKHRSEVIRERTREARLGAVGMQETEPRRVEEVSTQPGHGGSAIQHVASERVSDERQMGPDLVEDTGGDLDLDQRET